MKPFHSVALVLMPRNAKSLLFGVFDEQAISVLSTIARGPLKFGEVSAQTGLSKASLFRVLKRLEEGKLARRVAGGYVHSSAGDEVLSLVERFGSRHTNEAIEKLERRLREMEREYRNDRRVFHEDILWERTAEKPLAEVMAVQRMTGLQSLLLHEKIQEEVRYEEQALRRRSPVKR